MTARFSLVFAVVSAVALAQSPVQRPVATTVGTLLQKGKTFDGKRVVVSGKLVKVEKRTSKRGNPYTLFRLAEGEKSLAGYRRGPHDPKLKEGAKVRLVGTFRVEKKVGDRVVKNELDISPQIVIKKKA